jgi:hypothetical protein
MVIARRIDGDGVDRGVHNFLVPLRCMDTHKLVPGVTSRDIGPKIGYNVMDNGFARFENVIIPRRNMAMRFAHVDEQGKYSKKSVSDATSKVAYITTMQVRAYICNEASRNVKLPVPLLFGIPLSVARATERTELQNTKFSTTSRNSIVSFHYWRLLIVLYLPERNY